MKKRTRVLSIVSALACAVMAFAVAPVTASADSGYTTDPHFTGATCSVSGPTTVQKGSSNTYTHVCANHYDNKPDEYIDSSLLYPETVEWSIASSVSAGTTLTVANGYAVLNVAVDETASTIVVRTYDNFYENTGEITVHVAGNEGGTTTTGGGSYTSTPPSDAEPFWLDVHAAITRGQKNVTVNADGRTFVPFYVLDALRGKNATLTITCGLDNYVINGKSMKNLRFGASYAFGNLADILYTEADPNTRGGVTYSTQK